MGSNLLKREYKQVNVDKVRDIVEKAAGRHFLWEYLNKVRSEEKMNILGIGESNLRIHLIGTEGLILNI